MTGTVIIGAGVIGCATAYYLSLDDPEITWPITLIEAAPEPFHCASGLAGGFLAADWFAPRSASLGALSFKLHQELAAEYGGRENWGYSKSTSTSLSQVTDRSGARGDDWLREGTSRSQVAADFDHVPSHEPAWLIRPAGSNLKRISKDESTAQIDPLKLSKFLLSKSISRGVKFYTSAKVTSLRTDNHDTLSEASISLEGDQEVTIPCTRLLITAGPWTESVFRSLFPSSKLHLSISSLAGYSLVVQSPRWSKHAKDDIETSGCHAVFSTFATDAYSFSPEIVSRLGGEIYVAGLNTSSLPLPAPGVLPDLSSQEIDKLHDIAGRFLGLSDGKNDLVTIREGLCFRPISSSGQPIISRIPDIKLGSGLKTRAGKDGGVFVCAGHGPWGISLSLGSGKVMSELMLGKSTSADIGGLML